MSMKYLTAALAAACLTLPAAAAEEMCSGMASSAWPAAGEGYVVEGWAGGAKDCTKSVAVIVARAPNGEPLWTQSAPVGWIAGLNAATNSAELTKALGEWVTQTDGTLKTSADLPEWKTGADMPMMGEFPFYPYEGFDREAYEAVRALKQPMLCYVQGMESLGCWVFDKESGTFSQIGVQSFPG